jgi:hypothetical protein
MLNIDPENFGISALRVTAQHDHVTATLNFKLNSKHAEILML